jgi:phage-related minor tail protein
MVLKRAMGFDDKEEKYLASGLLAVEKYAEMIDALRDKMNAPLQGGSSIAEMLGLSDLEQAEAEVEKWEALVRTMTEARIKDDKPWTDKDLSFQTAVENLAEAKKKADAAFVTDTLEEYGRKVGDLGLSQEELARQTLIAKGATREELELFDEFVKQINAPADGDFQGKFTDWIDEGLDKLGLFDEKANEVFANLAYRLTSVSFDAMLTGFNEIGQAIARSEDAGTAFSNALAAMGEQLLNALPSLFLQAGLQLVATPGMWPIGLGLIAAAGAASLINGYVQGSREKAEQDAEANAQGNVFSGTAIVPYAAGGTFTNRIVHSPTLFRYGGRLGLMGEAGPEAVIPLKRMPDGNLGVEAGTGGGTQVTVNIINNSGQEAEKKESEDANGNRQIDVIVGRMINQHLSSGKADGVVTGRYDVRVRGM